MTLPTFCVPLICRPDSRSTSRNHLCTRGNPSGAARTDCRWPRRYKPPPHFPSDSTWSACLSRFYSSHPWAGVSEFKLLDGGVYDNMGTEWMFETQRRRGEAGAPPLHPVDEVVVVNASAGMESTPRPKVRWPLFGEIFAILAVKDVMYDQTTSVRRRLLHLRNLVETARARDQLNPRARVADDVLRGATVQIGRSPFAVPDGFKAGHDAAATRANDAIRLLSHEQNAGKADRRQHWETERVDNSKVKTTLFKYKIRPDRAVSLIRCAASPAGSPVRGRTPGRDQGI